MDITTWLKRIFYLVCGLVAAGMSTYWFNEYGLDKDSTTINYDQVKEVEFEARPVLSLCFNLKNMVKVDGSTSKGNLYLDFMKGAFFDPQSYREWLETVEEHKQVSNAITYNKNVIKQLLNDTFDRAFWDNIIYDNVTLHLADFIQEYEVSWKNGSSTKHFEFNMNLVRYPEISYSGTVLHTADFIKCFQVQIGHDEINTAKFTIRKEIFPQPVSFIYSQQQMRPQSQGLFTFIHRPNQILLSRNSLVHKWAKVGERDFRFSFDTWFTIESLEVLKRRHKKNKPCSRSENYDQNVIEDHITKIGCRTPFQKTDSEIPICSTGKNMQLAQYSISLENFDSHTFPRPCNSIESIKFNYEGN